MEDLRRQINSSSRDERTEKVPHTMEASESNLHFSSYAIELNQGIELPYRAAHGISTEPGEALHYSRRPQAHDAYDEESCEEFKEEINQTRAHKTTDNNTFHSSIRASASSYWYPTLLSKQQLQQFTWYYILPQREIFRRFIVPPPLLPF